MSSGRLILPLAEPVLSSAGLVQSGATLAVYNTGTTTLASIFAESGLVTPLGNPQTSNAAGRFYQQSTLIWADSSQAYDIVLSMPDGETFTYVAVYVLGAAPTITGYAPLASPTFTGNPQAPTPAANNSSSSIATTQFVTSAIGAISVFPTGFITLFGMTSLPSGWLACAGTAVSRTAYAALFGALGTTFGPGDGSTTFNLPDLRGQFVRGLDAGRGVDSGRALGTLQADQFQGHLMGPPAGSIGYIAQATSSTESTENGNNATPDIKVANTGPAVTDGTNGTPRTGTETRPTNVALVYAIKT